MPHFSSLFNDDPAWKPYQPGLSHTIPEPVVSWIEESGSLTKRLRDHYGDSFAVKILYHHWKPPFVSECRKLHTPFQQYNLIREVLLHADDVPLILARTILPEKTIRTAKRNLSHLGTRPLGEVIFSYPDLERLKLDVCIVKVDDWRPKLRQQISMEQAVWGRRTLYAIQKQPLLVSEFFLAGALAV